MNNGISESEQASVDNGLEVIGQTFSGITGFIANNWIIAALMFIPVLAGGIALFKKVVKKFSGGGK